MDIRWCNTASRPQVEDTLGFSFSERLVRGSVFQISRMITLYRRGQRRRNVHRKTTTQKIGDHAVEESHALRVQLNACGV